MESLYFGEFELLRSQRVLRGPGGDINLRPTSLNVLIYLANSAGRVVPKEELLEAIWPDVTVSEESLTRCISDIRAALSDTDRKILKTMSRRGYLFAAEVRSDPPPADVRNGTVRTVAPPARSHVRWMALLGVIAMLAVLAVQVALPARPLAADGKPILAILPLAESEAGSPDVYFSDGLTEDISLALSRFGSISVVAAPSAAKFKGSTSPLSEIGSQLSARFLLTGSLRRSAEDIVLTLQLVEAPTGVQVWSGQYDGSEAGFFGAKTELVGQIASILDHQITKSELDRVARNQDLDMTAYDLVLQGNALLRNTDAEDRGANIATARDLYQRAAAIDARYADAVEGIANTYLLAWLEPHPDGPLRSEFQSPNALKWAGDYARRAIELDETSATARATLGWILNWQSGPTEGLTLFDQALHLNPGLVDWRYGLLLSHGGRAEDAEVYMKRIMVTDPLHPPRYRYLLGKAYYFQGRYAEALPLIKQAAAQMPTHRPSHVLLTAVSAELGLSEELPVLVRDVFALDPKFTIKSWLAYIRISDAAYADRLRAGLREAGLPEG